MYVRYLTYLPKYPLTVGAHVVLVRSMENWLESPSMACSHRCLIVVTVSHVAIIAAYSNNNGKVPLEVMLGSPTKGKSIEGSYSDGLSTYLGRLVTGYIHY
jgi:hypothetical protein